ncbi:ArnT family glycosyltransferase [Candidatus Leptofilum sp.]|uniref:ArnT family glycosyltransferase n=1 Tax=Candidatus Leptofilum sp. TaxID=3241576 RepID=UPI003B5A9996
MPRFPKITLLLLTGLTAVLRAPGLFANSFQADEALFATWAREIAVWRDPLLAMQPVDKPPLLFYLQAIFYPLFGPVEFAARWPNWIASILLVPLTAVLAWKLYRRPGTAVLAAALIALFPLTIQFSPTAFTDPLMTGLLITGFTAVASQKPGWVGILFGLALLTKYQAILFLPLLLGLGWMYGWRLGRWSRWLAGLLPPLVGLIAWEFARSGRFLLWQTQISNFGGVRLSYSWELWPRFWAWVDLWQTAVSSLIFYLLIPALGWFLLNHLRSQTSPSAPLRLCAKNTDRLLFIFILGYSLFHWLWAIPVWDRYLLPLLPLLALLLARAYSGLLSQLPPAAPILQFRGAIVILVLLLISASWSARNGRYAIGSFPQADQGAAEIATVLADAPYGTVLYDHWFSWQWRYHLFDKRVFVNWFPHAQALADDLAAFGNDGSPRYLALPNTAVAQPILRTVENAGFTLTAVAQSNQIILYEIIYQQMSFLRRQESIPDKELDTHEGGYDTNITIKNPHNPRNLRLKNWGSQYALA